MNRNRVNLTARELWYSIEHDSDHKTWLATGGTEGRRYKVERARLTRMVLKAWPQDHDFAGVHFSDVQFAGDFRRVGFEQAKFTACRLGGDDEYSPLVDFDNANFKGAHFKDSKTMQASFERANLERVTLDGCKFARSYFDHANLKGVKNLQEATVFEFCHFYQANLAGIETEGAPITLNRCSSEETERGFRSRNFPQEGGSGGAIIDGLDLAAFRGPYGYPVSPSDNVFKDPVGMFGRISE